MKELLEKQAVFSIVLKGLSFFAKRSVFDGLTYWATKQVANLNLFLNKPIRAQEIDELATTWQEVMPPDGQNFFKVAEITQDTAFAEIHLHCPLRGSGDVMACYKLMNYDRHLMEEVGGELVVLESQANSGKSFCKLAIRKKGADLSDLTPAHKA